MNRAWIDRPETGSAATGSRSPLRLGPHLSASPLACDTLSLVRSVLIIAGLILLNGLFSMSELAIVSARPARLRMRRIAAARGAKTALDLAADPGKFLSTVQIGITLVGHHRRRLFGGQPGRSRGERLMALGVPGDSAPEAGFALVIIATTYFSLVVGELVPKQLALRAAEPIALSPPADGACGAGDRAVRLAARPFLQLAAAPARRAHVGRGGK
jgi:hypothetical protein